MIPRAPKVKFCPECGTECGNVLHDDGSLLGARCTRCGLSMTWIVRYVPKPGADGGYTSASVTTELRCSFVALEELRADAAPPVAILHPPPELEVVLAERRLESLALLDRTIAEHRDDARALDAMHEWVWHPPPAFAEASEGARALHILERLLERLEHIATRTGNEGARLLQQMRIEAEEGPLRGSTATVHPIRPPNGAGRPASSPPEPPPPHGAPPRKPRR